MKPIYKRIPKMDIHIFFEEISFLIIAIGKLDKKDIRIDTLLVCKYSVSFSF